VGNLITKYENFVFEADSTETKMSLTKTEISKIQDQLEDAKHKMLDAKKTAVNNAAEMQADANYLAQQIQLYGKMVPLMTNLKAQMDQRIAELKG
jgi:5-bromo-4-chloroindolyl phosphate hydrolysis protein